jgi:uncharacterized membrane protein
MTSTSPPAAEAPPTWGERFFGVLAYLSWWNPLLFLGPLLLYFWKGRSSRFIGFHTVQATLLLVGVMFVAGVVTFLVALLATTRVGARVSQTADLATLYLAGFTPIVGSLWMAIAIVARRPAVLPVIGRWATQVIARP